MNPDVRHALHAFAVLDGAFIVREDGVVVAAGRYLNFDEEKELDVPLGLGARHMAAAGISRDTESIAIVVSQTSGSVRVFRRGKAALELAPRIRGREFSREFATNLLIWRVPDTMAAVPMRILATAVLLAIVTVTASASPARADGDAEKARQLFNQGSKYYDLGQFDKAIEAWQQGYDQKPDPGFLYNIAQAYRQKQDAQRAIFFYKGYLRNSPKAHNRVEVEQKIAALQKQADQAGTPPPAADDGATGDDDAPGSDHDAPPGTTTPPVAANDPNSPGRRWRRRR